MLYLVGLGLRDVKDISVKGYETVQKADEVYAEFYTSVSSSLEDIEKFFSKKVNVLSREELENGFDSIIQKAKTKEVVLLVPGDPMAATTHVQFIIDAKEKNVPCQIIHSSSIFSAIGETGLQLYKFGYTVSIPFDEKATSYVQRIEQNKKEGLHTLCLLDLAPQEDKFLDINDALTRLVNLGVINQDTKVVVLNEMGTKNKIIKYDFVKNIENIKFKKGLGSIIIPGSLHFMEEEALEKLYG